MNSNILRTTVMMMTMDYVIDVIGKQRVVSDRNQTDHYRHEP